MEIKQNFAWKIVKESILSIKQNQKVNKHVPSSESTGKALPTLSRWRKCSKYNVQNLNETMIVYPVTHNKTQTLRRTCWRESTRVACKDVSGPQWAHDWQLTHCWPVLCRAAHRATNFRQGIAPCRVNDMGSARDDMINGFLMGSTI